jgi:uncharacterized protein YbaP (TraB family)
MRRKILFPALVVMCVVFAAFSQTRAVAAPAASAPSTSLHSLWKLQGKSNALYLLGSIHVLKQSDYPLAAPIETAFSNAQTVVFETDVGAAADPAAALAMLSKAMLPEGQTLQGQLSPEVYTMFTNHLQASSSPLPVEMFQQFMPSMAAVTIEGMELMKLGFNPLIGLDMHFWQLAKDENKEVLTLESTDEQLKLLTGLSKKEGEWFLKTTLQQMDDLKTEAGSMIQAWKTGDSASLEKLLNKYQGEAPDIIKRFATDRNVKWLPKIDGWAHGEKNVLVIVGAAHLVGKDGLVELLKKKGWKITQL